MGDASPCHLSLFSVICGFRPSQLCEVSSSLSPEDASIGEWKSCELSEVPVWVPCNQWQQPILGWPWLWSCDRTDTNARAKKPRGLDARKWNARALESNTVSSSYNLHMQELTAIVTQQGNNISSCSLPESSEMRLTLLRLQSNWTASRWVWVMNHRGYCKWDCPYTWPIHNSKWRSQAYV